MVVPDEDGVFDSYLHEDDGLSDAFLQGAFLRTRFRLTRSGDRIHLSSTVAGKGFTEFRRRGFRVVVRGCAIDRMDLNGVGMRANAGRIELDNQGQDFELSFAAPAAEAVAE